MPDHDAQRLLPVQLPRRVACGEGRVVHECGAGAHHDGVDLGPQVVRVVPRHLRGDPAARTVRCRDPAVQRGGDLERDERAPALDRRQPGAEQRPPLVGQQAGLHVDPGSAQPFRTAGGDGVRVRDRHDHATDARREEGLRAGTRAAGVVARFEGDDGGGAARRGVAVRGIGQRGDLGVRSPGAAVPALTEDLAVRAEQHAADAGVGAVRGTAPGDLQGAPHRLELRGCAHDGLAAGHAHLRTRGAPG